MFIQINTDNHVSGDEQFVGPIRDRLSNSLKRFDSRVTSFQVYLADENAQKGGTNDKKCTIEARLEGKQPVAVTAHAPTLQQAVTAAIDKIKASLESTLERMRQH